MVSIVFYRNPLRGTLYIKYREAGGNNRSVMPLDVLGCTRATLIHSTSGWIDRFGKSLKWIVMGIDVCNKRHERGIPSKCKSSTCVDYVPALCTHRPSHLPIEWSDEHFGFSNVSLNGLMIIERSCVNLTIRGRWSRNKVSVGEPAEGSL